MANLNREIVLENGEAIIGQTADTITFEDDDGTDYATLSATALTVTGDLAVNGDDITADSNLTINATGYVRIGDTGTPITAADDDDDLYVEGDLETGGNIYLTGHNIFNVISGSGTGTIVLATNPTGPGVAGDYNTLTYGSWLVQNTTNNGMAALMVDQQKGGDIFTASASGTPKFTIENDGDVTMVGDLTISGDDLIMGTNTSGFILVADGTNFNPVAMSGDITIDGTGATAIGNDKVTEADLKAVDTAADEECLTYETTTGDFEWQSCGDIKLETFTADGTYTEPSDAVMIVVETYGSGGGGGGGSAGIASTRKSGGGGGGAGASKTQTFSASGIASSVDITVPAGGSGGGSATDGTAGSTSCFSSGDACTGISKLMEGAGAVIRPQPVGVVEVVVDTPASVHPLPPKPAPPEVNLTAPQPVQTPKITAAQGVAAISKMADLPILAEVAEEEVQIWLTLDTMEAAVYTEAVAEEAGAE
ncbi:MAG: hypothetical protein UU32_C0004G0020 [Candidatus Woesebacteria bacterium GW2011_GWB1_41_10]|uniref:Uncharacterized protein n=1 Tax=Candidatus Woesebacteria bacterium GW2011_GWB1_41_10 TaxID=1618577 RepID=A0A0G0WT98_9BACT|nr:MAG: hypothetical protein UU32_C0004G0020 [Candidatus Woesebacteria bacterium GW2011_GWB1_41_10]